VTVRLALASAAPGLALLTAALLWPAANGWWFVAATYAASGVLAALLSTTSPAPRAHSRRRWWASAAAAAGVGVVAVAAATLVEPPLGPGGAPDVSRAVVPVALGMAVGGALVGPHVGPRLASGNAVVAPRGAWWGAFALGATLPFALEPAAITVGYAEYPWGLLLVAVPWTLWALALPLAWLAPISSLAARLVVAAAVAAGLGWAPLAVIATGSVQSLSLAERWGPLAVCIGAAVSLGSVLAASHTSVRASLTAGVGER